MISFWKTQWFKLLIAVVNLTLAFWYAFSPSPDTTTLEGINEAISILFNCSIYFIGFIVFSFASILCYFLDCLNLLEKKVEKYDVVCDLVNALSDANEIDRAQLQLLDDKISSLANYILNK